MNQLPDQKIAALATAFANRLSLRKAAAACDVNRDTALRYFRNFNGAESSAATVLPSESGEPVDHFLALARDLLSPDIVSRIDARLHELNEQHQDLKNIQRIAARMHETQTPA